MWHFVRSQNQTLRIRCGNSWFKEFEEDHSSPMGCSVVIIRHMYIITTNDSNNSSNNIHITYDDNTAVHRATCGKTSKSCMRFYSFISFLNVFDFIVSTSVAFTFAL